MSKLTTVVMELAELPDPTDDEVIAVLAKHEVTIGEFMCMDEHPGHWGYEVTLPNGAKAGWHHKLRRTRNNGGNNLFEVLKKGGWDEMP